MTTFDRERDLAQPNASDSRENEMIENATAFPSPAWAVTAPPEATRGDATGAVESTGHDVEEDVVTPVDEARRGHKNA